MIKFRKFMKTFLKRRYRILAVLGGVAVVVASGIAGADAYQDYRQEQQDRQAIAALVAQMEIPLTHGFHAVADYVRSYVWMHSKYQIDEEFYAHWGDTPVILAKIMAHARGDTDKRPHMECSSRSGITSMVLAYPGYRVRSVDIYKHASEYPAHSFIEVQNPETGAWEIQDTDFNMFWRRVADGRRVGIAEIVAADKLSAFEPCLDDAHCGWAVETRLGKSMANMRDRYGLAVVIDRVADERPLYVNRARFDWDTPVRINGHGALTYCAYRSKNCRGPIRFF